MRKIIIRHRLYSVIIITNIVITKTRIFVVANRLPTHHSPLKTYHSQFTIIRRNIFPVEITMMPAVKEINDQTNTQPNQEAHPIRIS